MSCDHIILKCYEDIVSLWETHTWSGCSTYAHWFSVGSQRVIKKCRRRNKILCTQGNSVSVVWYSSTKDKKKRTIGAEWTNRQRETLRRRNGARQKSHKKWKTGFTIIKKMKKKTSWKSRWKKKDENEK